MECTACEHVNPEGARFCNGCGAAFNGEAAAGSAEAERKQVSVLFCDVTGFTALSERLDPEETREVMGSVFERAAEIVGRYEGRIEKFIGDAVMAIFGVPTAHEDDPVRAVRAALELHEAVATLSPQVEARTGSPIALHSGINTGLVVTGELRFDHGTAGPLGDTINLAARLMNEAPSGEIWIGPETRRLVAHAFALDDLGERTFKGKAEPVHVTRARGVTSRGEPARFRGSFVGRQAELGALLGAVERMRDGEPSAFGILGDAGTGKTRLVDELRAQVGDDVRWLEGRAYPYAQDIPYAPILDLLNRSWGIEEDDPPARVREKLEAGTRGLLDAPEEALPYLLHLYDLEQAEGVVIEREAFRERLRATVQRLLAALAARGPMVVCIQDLHWADASTTELLAGLIGLADAPLLFVCNFRPGYAAPERMQVLELKELSARQTRELLSSLLDAEAPEALSQFIEARSDGNPFYVEEVVNSLIETHVLERGDEGWTLARSLSESEVPTTVRGVIAARIDRLDDGRKRVLRHAAVVGREFLHSVVAALTEDPDALVPSLNELMASDLIRAVEPDVEYIFKHALTQEVAYDGLLKSERQKLHERVAYAMEGVLADRIPEFVETLAWHFERGGVTDKAVHYLVAAGRKCVARYALDEAQSHFERAYALIPEQGRSEADCHTLVELISEWSHVFYYRDWIRDWIRLLKKHLADAERCGDAGLLAMYLGWLGNVQLFHGDLRGSIESLDRALPLGRESGNRIALAYAVAWRVHTVSALGDLEETIRCAGTLDLTDEEKRLHPYPALKALGGLATALTMSGRFRESFEVCHELAGFAQATGNARAAAMASGCEAGNWLFLLDFERAEAVTRKGIEDARDEVFGGFAAMYLGFALGLRQDMEACARHLEAWLPYREHHEDRWFGGFMSLAYGGAEAALERLSQGVRRILAIQRDSRERGAGQWVVTANNAEVTLWVSVARRDVTPTLGALLRNPWFVFTQAPFAAGKARKAIASMRRESDNGFRGFDPLTDLAEARLLSARRKKAGAREILARIRRTLENAGVDPNPEAVRALEAEIDA